MDSRPGQSSESSPRRGSDELRVSRSLVCGLGGLPPYLPLSCPPSQLEDTLLSGPFLQLPCLVWAQPFALPSPICSSGSPCLVSCQRPGSSSLWHLGIVQQAPRDSTGHQACKPQRPGRRQRVSLHPRQRSTLSLMALCPRPDSGPLAPLTLPHP